MSDPSARYVLAIDQGTTGTTVLVIDRDLQVLGRSTQEFPQYFPQPGWVEHDVDEIWSSVGAAVREALASSGVAPHQVAAIGITNQRETVALIDRRTGRALHRAIVWQCRRTSDQCRRLRGLGHEPLVRERTGLVLDPYFSATKMRWLLDHVPDAPHRTRSGEWGFGTIDTILVHRLTGGAQFVTDATNASRTLLLDIHTGGWDDDLLSLFGIPRPSLPRVVDSSGVVGVTRGLDFLPDGIPVAGIAGDQQSALVGQACFGVGEAKCTYGTGAFLLVNTGDTPIPSRHGLLTTVALQLQGRRTYALEGSCFVAGAAVQWLRDGLGIIGTSSQVEPLAAGVPDSAGVVFVPALAGLGAPHWRPDARGLLWGLDRGTTQAHVARAVLEGIGLQTRDLLEAMRVDAGQQIPVLRVDGGASRNGLLMQFQSDILGVPVERPAMVETTALGAAFLAGLATGVWSDLGAIRDVWSLERRFEPRMSDSDRQSHLARWEAAVSRA